MSKTKQYEIEVGQDLKDALKDYFDLADDRIMSAARHGVSEGINVLRDQVLANIQSSKFRYNSTTGKFGIPLIQGVRTYMWKKMPTGFVSVLGNQSKNDGTWRLRFFEMGVTRKNRGSIAPNWFLKNALSQQEAATQQVILAVEKTIDDINNEQ